MVIEVGRLANIAVVVVIVILAVGFWTGEAHVTSVGVVGIFSISSLTRCCSLTIVCVAGFSSDAVVLWLV